jgi:hypothetical protein
MIVAGVAIDERFGVGGEGKADSPEGNDRKKGNSNNKAQ